MDVFCQDCKESGPPEYDDGCIGSFEGPDGRMKREYARNLEGNSCGSCGSTDVVPVDELGDILEIMRGEER